MKKTSVLITSLCALGAAVAMAAPVPSVNIVGYQTVTCETGKWALISTAFQSVDGVPLKAANVISNQLPKGSRVLAYDASVPGYVTDSKAGLSALGVWSTNITFQGGMGLWIYTGSPAGGPATYSLMLGGQVPLESASTNSVYNGFNLLGFPYTASVYFTNTSLYKNSRKGDSITLWVDGAYFTRSKAGLSASGVWPPDVNDIILTPQTGFWYKSVSNLHFNVEDRPYNP